MGDVDDPDLYAAQPLWEWQESEMGKWVMARAVDTPEWHRQNHQFLLWGYEYIVVAKLKDSDYTFWTLKWGNEVEQRQA
jgi:citrate lyase beta subunit